MRIEETGSQEIARQLRAQCALLIAGSFEFDRALSEKVSKEAVELFVSETEERIERIEKLIEGLKTLAGFDRRLAEQGQD